MSEFVTMFHAETGNFAETTPEALEEVWKAKGWRLAEKATTDVANLPKERLEEIAAERGVDVSSAKTKAEIAAKLTKEG
jgi:hypothetical protein